MKEVKQPTLDTQELLSDLLQQEPETVTLSGKKYRIGWLHKANMRKFSHIMLKDKDPWRRNVKLCACILLNHRWGLFTWFLLNLWYGLYWRWLYYIKDVDQIEVAAVINCGQKKNTVRRIGCEYHISDRNDGHDDDDGSSRAWPSRTQWGAAYALAEKFPFLFERRFGIRAFDYWYGYSACQIDLMVMDQPVVDYGGSSKKSEKSMIGTKEEQDEMDSLAEAWLKKRKGESFVGKKVNLGDFVRGNI